MQNTRSVDGINGNKEKAMMDQDLLSNEQSESLSHKTDLNNISKILVNGLIRLYTKQKQTTETEQTKAFLGNYQASAKQVAYTGRESKNAVVTGSNLYSVSNLNNSNNSSNFISNNNIEI